MKIFIFGTGSSAEVFIKSLDVSKIHLIGFLDNDPRKQGAKFHGYPVLSPNVIQEHRFDFIFIASQYSVEIMKQLLDIGIHFDKIIPTDYYFHHQNISSIYTNIMQKVCKTKGNKVGKYKIAVLNYNYSNYQGYALYKFMPEYIKSKYEVDLVEDKDLAKLSTYDVICSSNFDGIYTHNYINFEMWHGFPLKKRL